MNKILCKYIKDYIKRLEHQVLTSNESNLRLHFVFFPKEIERLKMKWEYAKTIGNYTTDRGLIYCDMYFNIPKISKFLSSAYKYNNILEKEVVDSFIERIFYHEYRHYQQLNYIKTLHKLIMIPDKINEVLETDADNYAMMKIKNNKDISIEVPDKMIKDMKDYIRILYHKNLNITSLNVYKGTTILT